MSSAAVATASVAARRPPRLASADKVARPARVARAADRIWLERLRALADLNGQIIWVADADGNILDEVGFSAYTGLRHEAALGWSWLQVVHPKDRAPAAASWTRSVAEQRHHEIELRILGADGQYRRYLVRATPIRDAAGTVREWVGGCSELTEQPHRADAQGDTWGNAHGDAQGDAQGDAHKASNAAQQEQEREQERLAREAAERERIPEVLEVVAHELRNPLTGIKTVLQMTRRHVERDEPVAPSQLESLARGVRRMEALVQDLIRAARLKGERQALMLDRRDLRVLCRQIVHDQRLATGHGIALSLTRKPALADVDAIRMTQVLSNLISNAHKYSPAESPIAVRLAITGGYARISVSDDGPGIPLDAQEHLFQRFYRVPGIEPVHDADGGLGLGLAICRELIEQHRGHIGVESLPGRGSTFWVTLPLAPAE